MRVVRLSDHPTPLAVGEDPTGVRGRDDEVGCLALEREFGPKLQTYGGWFRTLADPTRILNLLRRSEEPVGVRDIVGDFPLGQPTITPHLEELRAVRFVALERDGRSIHYRISHTRLCEPPERPRKKPATL